MTFADKQMLLNQAAIMQALLRMGSALCGTAWDRMTDMRQTLEAEVQQTKDYLRNN